MKEYGVGRLGRASGAIGGVGLALLLGACEVEVGKAHPYSAPPPPPPGPVAQGPARPAPPPPPAAHNAPAPPPPPHNAPPPPATVKPMTPRLFIPPPPPPPQPVPGRTGRVIHPLPVPNLGSQQTILDIPHIVLRANAKCGPRELGGGHWIHLDCNVHVPIASAKPASLEAHKLTLVLKGGLKLDSPVSATLPDAVDHRNDGTEGPIKDQGQVGSCTSFSLSSAMDNGIRRQNKGDTMSSLHIWSHYGYPAMQSAANASLNRGIADWAVWPYDERIACELDQSGQPNDCGPYSPPVTQGAGPSDPKVEASEKAADAAGQWKVTEFDSSPTDPDSIAALLATGSDVWFSMDIGDSWMNPNGDTIADWNDGSIDGGHAVLFAGYRHVNGQRQFLVHNSWGTDWANNGYAYISEAMVRQYIKTAYKVVVANTTQPPPPPNNSNSLTDDDCAANQLVDSVTGQCANMCPDDSRPANGQCWGGAGAAGGAGPTGGKAPPPKGPPPGKH
jgi:hypothetical protein